ncbi:MAG: response regulator [Cyanobacteria bacterium P01_A01_bin.105]
MSSLVILCVDDESIIRDSLLQQLKGAFRGEYDCETAADATEALEVIEDVVDEGNNLVVIVSDWLMPGMKGDEFLIQVHQKYPNVVKILLTGQADDAAIARAHQEANLHAYLPKPWKKEDLISTIQSGMETIP